MTSQLETSLVDELISVVDWCNANDAISVLILTGAGDSVFCAGADLKAISAGRRADLYTADGGFAGIVDLPRSKPWIAAINGAALGGGLEIALACDIIVASTTARFGLPEVTRGLIAAAGGLYRLPRRIPMGSAMRMIATGEIISAQRAADLGLVDELTADSSPLGAARQIAMQIAHNARACLSKPPA